MLVQQITYGAFPTHVVKNTWIDLICRNVEILDPNVVFLPAPTCVENVLQYLFQMQHIRRYVLGQNYFQCVGDYVQNA